MEESLFLPVPVGWSNLNVVSRNQTAPEESQEIIQLDSAPLGLAHPQKQSIPQRLIKN